MDLRSYARSNRSRSKTPLLFTSMNNGQEIVKEAHVQQSISRITRRTSSKLSNTDEGDTVDNLNQENSSNDNKKASTFKRITRSTKFFKTSDYSSEEGENEVTSTGNVNEYERHRILEDAKKLSEESSGITALGLYRKAKRYWDEYPKTDWTYSPFSKDRVEITPGVVAMPNMSRRHVSSYNLYTQATNSSFLTKRTLFSDGSETTQNITVINMVKNLAISPLLFIMTIMNFFWRSASYILVCAHVLAFKFAKHIYRVTCCVMLMDTWLLRRKKSERKTNSLIALCMVPLLLLAGFNIYVVTGISIAPSCHPNCGKIVGVYLKALSNYVFSIFENTIKIVNNN